MFWKLFLSLRFLRGRRVVGSRTHWRRVLGTFYSNRGRRNRVILLRGRISIGDSSRTIGRAVSRTRKIAPRSCAVLRLLLWKRNVLNSLRLIDRSGRGLVSLQDRRLLRGLVNSLNGYLLNRLLSSLRSSNQQFVFSRCQSIVRNKIFWPPHCINQSRKVILGYGPWHLLF